MWARVDMTDMDGEKGPVEFDKVRENAAAQNIDLRAIAIKYERLTSDELDELATRGLLTHDLQNGSAFGKFADDGTVLFPSRATGVHLLGE